MVAHQSAHKLTINANDGAIVAADRPLVEAAIGVEIVVALQGQARAAAALEGEGAVVTVDEEVDTARVAVGVEDGGVARADVGGCVSPAMR